MSVAVAEIADLSALAMPAALDDRGMFHVRLVRTGVEKALEITAACGGRSLGVQHHETLASGT